MNEDVIMKSVLKKGRVFFCYIPRSTALETDPDTTKHIERSVNTFKKLIENADYKDVAVIIANRRSNGTSFYLAETLIRRMLETLPKQLSSIAQRDFIKEIVWLRDSTFERAGEGASTKEILKEGSAENILDLPCHAQVFGRSVSKTIFLRRISDATLFRKSNAKVLGVNRFVANKVVLHERLYSPECSPQWRSESLAIVNNLSFVEDELNVIGHMTMLEESMFQRFSTGKTRRAAQHFTMSGTWYSNKLRPTYEPTRLAASGFFSTIVKLKRKGSEISVYNLSESGWTVVCGSAKIIKIV